MLARTVRVVVVRVELDDAPGRLREPVHPEQRATEGPQRRFEHRRGDRRGAIGDRPQRGVVALRRAGDGGQHLEDRGHEDGVGHARRLEQVEHRRRVEVADQDCRGALREPEKRPADPADVEHRQRRQADGRRVEAPGRDVERRRRQVALRGQHPLGHARGPRRVHLHHRIRSLPAATGIRGLGCHQPSLVVVAHADDLEPLRDAGGDGGGNVGERRPRNQHRGAGVGDDGR